MYYALCMYVIDGHEEFLHVVCSFTFSKPCSILFRNFVEEFTAIDVLHYKIEILIIIIGFEVLDDVGVIKFVQYFHLLYDLVDVVA